MSWKEDEMGEFSLRGFGISPGVTFSLMAARAALGGQKVSAQPKVLVQPLLQLQSSNTPAPMQMATWGDTIRDKREVRGADNQEYAGVPS